MGRATVVKVRAVLGSALGAELGTSLSTAGPMTPIRSFALHSSKSLTLYAACRARVHLPYDKVCSHWGQCSVNGGWIQALAFAAVAEIVQYPALLAQSRTSVFTAAWLHGEP